MDIACGVIACFNEPIFVHIDVSLVTVGTLTFAIGTSLDVPASLGILGGIAIFVLVRTALIRFYHTGINYADLTRLDSPCSPSCLLISLSNPPIKDRFSSFCLNRQMVE